MMASYKCNVPTEKRENFKPETQIAYGLAAAGNI